MLFGRLGDGSIHNTWDFFFWHWQGCIVIGWRGEMHCEDIELSGIGSFIVILVRGSSIFA